LVRAGSMVFWVSYFDTNRVPLLFYPGNTNVVVLAFFEL